MKVAIIRFPGTNCEFDTEYAFNIIGAKTTIVWHKDQTLPKDIDLVVLPGGFSYGDYLRSGAIARFSPIMQAVQEFAKKGGYVLGICNGFQILLESHLLPGAMKRNENLHFVSKFQYIKVLSNNNKFLSLLENGEILNIPIAHAEGNYYVQEEILKSMYDNDQVILQYCDKNGEYDNPNGSVDAIAGICNKEKNVFGLMPHPERACEKILGSEDGIMMIKGFMY
ncbi:phosphoribosylformylglycinamidine synthase subunit PurQ / glutaminase [Nitratiruptor sp. YY08-26]|uniref:phosphoribosylformylglycinamidine synthase I n=1 Tax=unclassified Nitratiruptor TaxID=2624044 RepID=UPI001915EC8E|nr:MULTISPECIES: phosphoribosylformylglycinamidine synthase I [unclassified Nitratiruptor]BCD62334.1 phosphoribosylformylglycinamidine synthase subunit PurQ / glutaminase [Nitratiruptor sp. YY08-13]BCD66270.1 phosphoribosylformylglycinamidine synthase subunit PurQ / glutaminase [Nitratiruptor sp. YY08-26]